MAKPKLVYSADGDARLGALPVAALACRALRHSWARPGDKRRHRVIVTRRQHGRVVEYRREMLCTGDCGILRSETFFVSAGRSYRDGGIRYRQDPERPYYLPKPDDGERYERPHSDAIQYALLTRAHPDLKWA